MPVINHRFLRLPWISKTSIVGDTPHRKNNVVVLKSDGESAT